MRAWFSFFLVLSAALPASMAQTVQVYETDGDQSKLLTARPGLTFSSGPPAGSPPLTITVNTANTFQQWDGVGASLTDSAGWVIWNKLTTAQQTGLMLSLFDPYQGIGINILRQPMGASDFSASGNYTYDDVAAGETDLNLLQFSIAHDQQYLIPLLHDALAVNPALKIQALPWSPPAWMKTSDSMNGGSVLTADFPALAQYFVKFIDAYEQSGLPIWAIAMQNEPLNSTAGYPSAYVDSADEANFIGNYLGPALAGAGLGGVDIFAYEHNWDQPSYPEQVLSDAAAYGFVAGSSFHCYAGDVANQAEVEQAYPNKGIWFTECSGTVGSSFAGDLAWNTENLLIGSTRNWARGITLWNIALDQNSGPQNGGCTNCRGVVTIDDSISPAQISRNVEYYVLGHLGKFVQPGALRVDSNTYGPGSLEDVAFLNPDGSVVMVVLNATPVAATFGVTWQAGSFTDTLPAGAVATYVWAVPAPEFPADGAINAASPSAGLSPGELFSIYGTNLAAGTAQPALLPLPATMAAATVQVNGVAAPLVYVSPLQINAQVPWEAVSGNATLTVSHGGVTAAQNVTIAAAAPAIFTLYGSPQAAALNEDYTVNSQSNPAPPGQAILLYGTGFGAVSPAVADGTAAGSDSQVIAKVTATVGGVAANVLFAGLAPGFAGLWQINVLLPPGQSGAVPVIVSVGNTASNTVSVWMP